MFLQPPHPYQTQCTNTKNLTECRPQVTRRQNDDYPHSPTLEGLGEMEGEIGGLLNQAQQLDGLYAEIEEIPELDGLPYATVSSAIAGTSTKAADEADSQGMISGP